MVLIITNQHINQAKGFIHTHNPVAVAFKQSNPAMKNVAYHNGRLTATQKGHPVRYRVSGFNADGYNKLASSEIEILCCRLTPIPVTQPNGQ